MFSRHSATVVDAMWAACCLPTVQRVTSHVKVVLGASSSDALCCACTLFHQCPQLRTICHPVVQQPSSTTYRRAWTVSSSLCLPRAMLGYYGLRASRLWIIFNWSVSCFVTEDRDSSKLLAECIDKDKVFGSGDGASPVKEMKNSDRFVGLLCKPKTLQQ